jgi:CheY-like chemotaxis protein
MTDAQKENEKVFHILIIEDDRAYARLLINAWSGCDRVKTKTYVLEDSRAALPFLMNQLEYEGANNPRPHIILLDYKMPVDGGIALTTLKGEPNFMDIPVIVLTGSQDPVDLRHIYLRRANCCFHKPLGWDELQQLIVLIADHWLLRAVLPPPVGC